MSDCTLGHALEPDDEGGVYCANCGRKWLCGSAPVAAPGPAASPPTDVVSENNRVELRKALFADPAAGETGTGEGHAERLSWLADRVNEPVSNAALRAGAEALQDNAILDMNLSAAREEIEALAEGQAQLRERVRVLEGALEEIATGRCREFALPEDCIKWNVREGWCDKCIARSALAPPADRDSITLPEMDLAQIPTERLREIATEARERTDDDDDPWAIAAACIGAEIQRRKKGRADALLRRLGGADAEAERRRIAASYEMHEQNPPQDWEDTA